MSEETENTTGLESISGEIDRVSLLNQTSELSEQQRARIIYDSDEVPLADKIEVAQRNKDTGWHMQLTMQQHDESQVTPNIMDQVAETRTDEDGNEVEVTYGDLQAEAHAAGDVGASLRAYTAAQDAAEQKEREAALEEMADSETMDWLRKREQEGGEEFLEQNPHLDPDQEEEEEFESSYADLPPHLRLDETDDNVGPMQVARAKHRKAQKQGDVRGSIEAAVQIMDQMSDDAA